jgi:hypothetical protein
VWPDMGDAVMQRRPAPRGGGRARRDPGRPIHGALIPRRRARRPHVAAARQGQAGARGGAAPGGASTASATHRPPPATSCGAAGSSSVCNETFERVVRARRPEMVTVVGPAGIGMSRLARAGGTRVGQRGGRSRPMPALRRRHHVLARGGDRPPDQPSPRGDGDRRPAGGGEEGRRVAERVVRVIGMLRGGVAVEQGAGPCAASSRHERRSGRSSWCATSRTSSCPWRHAPTFTSATRRARSARRAPVRRARRLPPRAGPPLARRAASRWRAGAPRAGDRRRPPAGDGRPRRPGARRPAGRRQPARANRGAAARRRLGSRGGRAGARARARPAGPSGPGPRRC